MSAVMASRGMLLGAAPLQTSRFVAPGDQWHVLDGHVACVTAHAGDRSID